MRNDALKSMSVPLNHESQESRGVSAIGPTIQADRDQDHPASLGIALLGGKASALIRSAAPPQSQAPPAS
jgi:hypothetical protein